MQENFFFIRLEGSGSAFGSGSIIQRHGSADPDPHQNVMDPEHCKKDEASHLIILYEEV